MATITTHPAGVHWNFTTLGVDRFKPTVDSVVISTATLFTWLTPEGERLTILGSFTYPGGATTPSGTITEFRYDNTNDGTDDVTVDLAASPVAIPASFFTSEILFLSTLLGQSNTATFTSLAGSGTFSVNGLSGTQSFSDTITIEVSAVGWLAADLYQADDGFVGADDTIETTTTDEGAPFAVEVSGDADRVSTNATVTGGDDIFTDLTPASVANYIRFNGDFEQVSFTNLTVYGGDDVMTVSSSGTSELVGDVSSLTGNGSILYAGDDTITGGAGADNIFGDIRTASGSTTVAVDAGSDTLMGGAGNDRIYGEFKAPSGTLVYDIIFSGLGEDTINGDGGDDELWGQYGDDILDGGADDDELRGGDGDDILNGGTGNDILFGGTGSDTIDGGAGNDTADFSESAVGVTVTLGLAGASGAASGNGDDVLTSIENVTGSAQNDQITGNGDANVIAGNGGSDEIAGLGGNDTFTVLSGQTALINGGGGIDTLDLSDLYFFGTVSTIDLSLTVAQDVGNGTTLTIQNVEAVIGHGSDNIFRGTAAAQSFDGGDDYGDDDTIDYSNAAAAVAVDLAVETPQQTGGGGLDRLLNIEHAIGTSFADSLFGTFFENTLEGGDGDDVLEGRHSGDELIGGAGEDTASYASAPAAVFVYLDGSAGNWGEAFGDTFDSIENLLGSAHDDILHGDAQSNDIDGSDGNDVIEGGAGGDVLDGGADFDFASYSTAATAVRAQLNTQVANTGDALGDTYNSVEGLIGSAFNDFLVADTGDNELRGGAGNDFMNGLAGIDTLLGEGGTDTLFGGPDGDVLDGGADIDFVSYSDAVTGVNAQLNTNVNNTGDAAGDTYISIEGIIGSAATDRLVGDAGANIFRSGAGGDVLAGMEGGDTYTMDAGNDRVVIGSAAHSAPGVGNRDQITDWEDFGDDDTIDLSGIAGTLSFIGAAAFSAPNQVRAVQVAANVIVQINTVGVGIAEGEIFLANTNIAQVDATDFIL